MSLVQTYAINGRHWIQLIVDTAAKAIESSILYHGAPAPPRRNYEHSLHTTSPTCVYLPLPTPLPLHAVSTLQAERDDLMLHLIFTKGVTEDLQTNVKVMKNVKSKVGAEKSRAEEQKLKQVR